MRMLLAEGDVYKSRRNDVSACLCVYVPACVGGINKDTKHLRGSIEGGRESSMGEFGGL